MAFNVLIRNIDDSCTIIDLDVDITTKQLKNIFARDADIDETLFDLTFEGDEMINEELIINCGITSGSEIEVVRSKKAVALELLEGIDVSITNFMREVQRGSKLVESFIHAGLPVDCKIGSECALHKVTSTDVAKVLLDHNANMNVQDHQGNTPLHVSLKSNFSCDLSKLLIAYGADLGLHNCSGNTPLHVACRHLRHDMVQLLLASGADVDAVDRQGDTSLSKILLAGNSITRSGIVSQLLKANSDVCLLNNSHQAPLHLAVKSNDNQIVELIVKEATSFDVSIRNRFDCTALHLVRNVEIAEMLLSVKEIDLSVCDKEGYTPLHAAAIGSRPEVGILLLKRGVDPSVRCNYGRTALHLVKDEEFAKELLDSHHLDIDLQDNGGNSCLHLASLNNILEVCKLLVETGCDIDLRNSVGQSALHLTTNHHIAQLLVEGNVNINNEDCNGDTPLHTSLQNSCFEVARTLIKSGADINIKSGLGRSPLHIARHPEIIRLLLLRSDIDVDCQDCFGFTPLHYVMIKSHLGVNSVPHRTRFCYRNY